MPKCVVILFLFTAASKKFFLAMSLTYIMMEMQIRMPSSWIQFLF